MSENQNEIGASSQNLDELKSILQKKTTNESNGSTKKTKEEILSKYFVPRKPKETFRPLPPSNKNKDIFEEAYFHVVEVATNGGVKRFKKLYCPAHNDPKVPKLDPNGNPVLDQLGKPVMITPPCPLCQKSRDILGKQDPSVKNIKKEDIKSLSPEQKEIYEKNRQIYIYAQKYAAKKFYIVKGIDKGAEKDGVKFWRFKHNYKKDGIMDKLTPVLSDFIDNYGVAYYDVETGADLSLTVVEQRMPNGRPYLAVSMITTRQSKLHQDPVVVSSWINDKTTWKEIFKPTVAPNITAYDYLRLVALNQEPYWDDSDTNNKHWVFPGNPELQELANNKNRNLDEGSSFERFDEYTSDYDEDNMSINDMDASHVGTFKDNSVDITAEFNKTSAASAPVKQQSSSSSVLSDIDDLPF